MNIRAANESDYPYLRTIFLESRRANFHWVDKETLALEDFDKQTEDEYIILAEEDQLIVGFTSLYLPDNFIHHLFVHPDSFGKGVGGKLLAAAIDKMDKPLSLKCVSVNQNALSFYESKGWTKVVEEEKFGEKYWVMEYK